MKKLRRYLILSLLNLGLFLIVDLIIEKFGNPISASVSVNQVNDSIIEYSMSNWFMYTENLECINISVIVLFQIILFLWFTTSIFKKD